MIGYERKRSYFDSYVRNTSLVGLQGELNAEQSARLTKIRTCWNFYEGYHWENMPEQDGAEVTINFCRAFVDKYVSFELGSGFTFQLKKDLSSQVIDSNGTTLYEYLDNVWKDNGKYLFCTEMGQMKSVTGEAWVKVTFEEQEEFDDPFNEYPNGRVRIQLVPTAVVFPTYDPHQRGLLTSVTIMYMYTRSYRTSILGKFREEKVLFKQVWTKDEVATYDGSNSPEVVPNKYGIIPFVQINNLPLAGRNDGKSDLEDLIPLNVEYNLKQSNVSEIIDYHSAPVTILYGAKVGNLEKGAHKMWGGLSKDARVENLEVHGDSGLSSNYTSELKQAMCEIGCIPEASLGGNQAISNTSGVALQYQNMPLLEKTRNKRMCTELGIEKINKIIILISLLEGLIVRPDGFTNKDLFWNEVTVPDTLPKDMMMELQQIQQEISLGLESRIGALKRLNKENIEQLLEEIQADRQEHPEFYGQVETKINSGMTNGETPIEQVRKEMTGENGNQNHEGRPK